MKLLFGIVTLGILAVLFGLSWYRANLQPVGAGSSDSIVFVVPKGQSVKTILKRLEEDRLIQSAKAAELYLYVSDNKNTLQAGSFRLSPGDSTPAIVEKLKHGTLDLWVTIPEGWRSEQIVDELVKTGYFLDTFDGVQAPLFRVGKEAPLSVNLFEPEPQSRRPEQDPAFRPESRRVDIEREELYRRFQEREGYLFPDTYLFARTATPEQMIVKMTDTFEGKVRTITDQPINSLTNQLILASLVEREAKHDQDRSLVASVLANRFKIGMALQIDATLQYAKASQESGVRSMESGATEWWPQITVADKSIKSLYNTYLHAGLPPAPIANPGLESIKAALQPAQTDYLYYLSEPDGTTHYATTLTEHNENIQKYLR